MSLNYVSLFSDTCANLKIRNTLSAGAVSLYDAMRRGLIYLEVQVGGDTSTFLRGQIVATQSVCF